MFVLDTNALIYYTTGDKVAVHFFDTHENSLLYVPSIVVAEYLSYPSLTPEAMAAFKQFTSKAIILNLDFSSAELAAAIKRNYKIKLDDAIIAASSMLVGSILVTRNIRDFKKIKGLKLIEI